MMQKLKKLPPVSLFCSGLSIGMLLVCCLFVRHEITVGQKVLDDYGRALAGLAANGVVDAMLNHDLVSLQVILQDVSANPRVLLATIHDVENNLLVQAGDINLTKVAESKALFTAPIPLHNSVAGYVAITLDNAWPLGGLPYFLGGLGIVLMLISGIYLKLHLPVNEVHSGLDVDDALDELDVEEPPSTLGNELLQAPKATGVLSIVLCNQALLEKQLSARMLEETMSEFEKGIRSVATLYGGDLMSKSQEAAPQSCYRLLIPSFDSASDAFLKALCAGFLLSQVPLSRKFKLDIAATASIVDDVSVDEMVFCASKGTYCETRWVSDNIRERFILEPLASEKPLAGEEPLASDKPLADEEPLSDEGQSHDVTDDDTSPTEGGISLCRVIDSVPPFDQMLDKQRDKLVMRLHHNRPQESGR